MLYLNIKPLLLGEYMNTLFPFNHSKNHDDLLLGYKKDGVAMMMGIEAQGYQAFVKRSLDDGAGWTEIAKVI